MQDEKSRRESKRLFSFGLWYSKRDDIETHLQLPVVAVAS
jgi:hypothetical protein